jgi:type I restriction enzyme S subunit
MEFVPLGAVASVKSGYAFKSKDWTEDGVPVIKIANVKEGFVSLDGCSFVSEAVARSAAPFELRPGDILISMTGYIGEVARVRNEGRMLLNQRVGKFSVKNPTRLDNDFLFHCLRDPEMKSKFAAHAYGAAQPNISPSLIEQQVIPLPALPTQRRIAGILSAYDDLIENSQRRIKILESMARALYREWFVHFRFPGHENQPRVASQLGEIPEGWEVKKLGDVAETFRGRSYRSVDLADEGGLPFLNLKCLERDGGFRRSGLKRYIGEFRDIHVAKKGDIVMAVTDMTQERRIVARAALVPTMESEFGIFSMDLVRIEPKPGFPKAFLYSLLRYSSFSDEVKQHANGANVLHLSPDRITEYRFIAPPMDLMSRLASFVAPVVDEIDTIANKIDNLRRTRDLLLPRLLSGQIALDELEAA